LRYVSCAVDSRKNRGNSAGRRVAAARPAIVWPWKPHGSGVVETVVVAPGEVVFSDGDEAIVVASHSASSSAA
jgi:hypothetical protein